MAPAPGASMKPRLARLALVAGILSACGRAVDAPRAVASSADTSPAAETSPAAAAEPLRYDRDIRPILADRCFRCHGPDERARQGELRLDLFAGATLDRGGYAAVVPGSHVESELWRRVTHADPEERMPPAKSNRRPLSAAEVALVERWIDEGARYEPHWSFVPPARPPEPAVGDEAWCRNPIDRFVRERLEHEGVEPSPPAGPETLLRRVFLDLTGLPPTPEELEQFLADSGADASAGDVPGAAYERWVRRLLTEEPYRTRHAERMATPWLDQSRYADTCGIHMDAGRQMWLWRDWVLEAYRSNMPFDRFLTEQLAGDLLPGATEAQKIASGFNRNHVTTDEGGAIAEEYLVEYAVDRAATTGSVFLGLTLGCARCHEHKFDPIGQEEFYRFYSFFNSIEEPGLYSQLPDPERAFEPFLVVPTEEQTAGMAELRAAREREEEELDRPVPGEDEIRQVFFAELLEQSGVAWEEDAVVLAESAGGAALAVQPDGSVLATGANPDQDEHALTLRTQGTGLRLLLVEALTDPSLAAGDDAAPVADGTGEGDPHGTGRVGRAPNGNAVLSGISAEAVSLADRSRRVPLAVTWAWADHEQDGESEFGVVNALDPDPLGWAVDGHRREGGRAALFLAAEPFGFEGGTEVVVRLAYRSQYAQHALGRVRLSLGHIGSSGLDALPAAASDWLFAGPFPDEAPGAGYRRSFGPESDAGLDRARNFGFGNQSWRFDPEIADGKPNPLPSGVNVTYVGRRLFVPTARTVRVSLGTDDGYRLFLDGLELASREVDRALEADQEELEVALPAGTHVLVLAVVNTGGEAGFYWRAEPREQELAGDLVAAFLPESARWPELTARRDRGWRLAFSPEYRARTEKIEALGQELAALEAALPRTMVMQELAEPRETYLLMRGAYDRPDRERPVTRGVPAVLGQLPEGAPPDRLGLAQWMTAPENPLVARVAVNRLWELVFGEGLVRTSEDFGHQGEWPSHPELLDWLAVEFRESGWDVQHLLELLVTSSTYRQGSRARPELAERDPGNRWLAFFPRKRLEAEALRDQALFLAGLLVERLGGPSVKPYQPEGLWQEVAMTQSNTREYEVGEGDELWRRSLYTYWKRACPPPSLMTFDAPTREFCTIRRASTNTPLQALVLWNDEQFVEAARALAVRTLDTRTLAAPPSSPEAALDDRTRLSQLFRRCTGRGPDGEELEALAEGLAGFRERYRLAPEDAAGLLEVGEAANPAELDPAELAAWTLVASAVLNLDAVLTRG